MYLYRRLDHSVHWASEIVVVNVFIPIEMTGLKQSFIALFGRWAEIAVKVKRGQGLVRVRSEVTGRVHRDEINPAPLRFGSNSSELKSPSRYFHPSQERVSTVTPLCLVLLVFTFSRYYQSQAIECQDTSIAMKYSKVSDLLAT